MTTPGITIFFSPAIISSCLAYQDWYLTKRMYNICEVTEVPWTLVYGRNSVSKTLNNTALLQQIFNTSLVKKTFKKYIIFSLHGNSMWLINWIPMCYVVWVEEWSDAPFVMCSLNSKYFLWIRVLSEASKEF